MQAHEQQRTAQVVGRTGGAGAGEVYVARGMAGAVEIRVCLGARLIARMEFDAGEVPASLIADAGRWWRAWLVDRGLGVTADVAPPVESSPPALRVLRGGASEDRLPRAAAARGLRRGTA